MEKNELKSEREWIKNGKAKVIMIASCEVFATNVPCGNIEPEELGDGCYNCKEQGNHIIQIAIDHGHKPNYAVIGSYLVTKELADEFKEFVDGLA